MTVSPHFAHRNGVLHAENIPLTDLAERYGTPLYVYSRQALHDAWSSYERATQGRNVLVCYGMKANSNLAVLNEFRKWGAGFDIVSGGELARVLAVGGDPSKIVFSGVGKQAWEMKAALDAGVKCFNVESHAELLKLAEVAHALGKIAPVSLRVNPDVDARTHPYISTGLKENKFGIDIEEAPAIYALAKSLPSIKVVGLDCHIGSQIVEVAPYLDALDKLVSLIKNLKQQGIDIHHLDLGGGIGIRYTDETPLTPSDLVDRVLDTLQANDLGHLQLVLEPGRSLVGNAGILLTRIHYLKPGSVRNFAIVDAAMNDLIRPTLYDAWHSVEAVEPRPEQEQTPIYDIVGPICESGDWLARQRPLNVQANDLLAIMSAGAYAFTMASHYNTRPHPAEIMVDGDTAHVIRPRETIEQLFSTEAVVP